MIRGVLLDVDGTLVLSNDAHARAWVGAFAEFGYTVDYDEIRGLLGMGGDQLIPRVVPNLDADSGPGKEISEQSKPAPDIVHVARTKAEMSAAEVVMLGDSPFDIESAGRAGVGVIAVRCGGFSDDALHGSLAIYDDPADLVTHFAESPLVTHPAFSG